MKELARIAREEASHEGADAEELLRPFSEGELASMTAAVTEKVAKGEPAAAPSAATARAQARWRRSTTIGVFLFAAAAALFFWMRTTPSATPIAMYALTIEGGDRASRSGDPAPSGPVKVSPGGRLVIVARPEKPVGEQVSAVVRVAKGDALMAWDVPVQVSVEGAVRIDADPTALARLPDGTSTLVIFVGRPEALPKDETSARAIRSSPPAALRVLERPLERAP